MRQAKALGIAVGLSFVIACGGNAGDDTGDDAPTYQPPYGQCDGTSVVPLPPSGSLCLVDPLQPPGTSPLAVIEHRFEDYMGIPAVHISLVFDPAFVDNTFGNNAVGWTRHRFGDLVGSDHATVVLLNASGEVVFDLDIDYISADPSKPCGYGCLGVTGGDGGINVGDPAAILLVTSSLDQNLNERGYCLVDDSPASDAACTPNPMYPNWDFRVVYEIWIALSAFDPNMFGSAFMSFVHASPSKAADNTIDVVPGECPCTEIDPGDCAPAPSGDCTTSAECSTEEFCYGGQCVPIIT